MQQKFNRVYQLEVTNLTNGTKKTVMLPFTLKMSITRTFGKAQNFGRIQIYNLNESSRSFMRKDITDIGFTHSVQLKAGYGKDLSTCIVGSLKLGYSERIGQDYVTNLDVSDMAVAYNLSNVSLAFGAQASERSILSSLARSLNVHGIEFGAISDRYNGRTFRGSAFSGNAIDHIDELTDGSFFIDNGQIFICKDDEYLAGQVLVINSSTGLIGKPRIDGTNVVVTMLFEPKAFIRQKVKIDLGDKTFSGDYVIQNITHNGTISDAVGESLTTDITCTPARFAVELKR